MDGADHLPVVPLTYTIAGSSEHSGRYAPQNIMVDRPADHTSRWSGGTRSTETVQWILLRLDSPAILKSVTFGKFYKSHPCNMKEFKLYVGLDEDNMTEVLHAELKNDHIPETFAIRDVNRAGLAFPTRYVKIQPLSAYGQSFHTSIWYVSLSGIADERFVSAIINKHEEFQEKLILRHVLKHLRRRRFLGPFESLLQRSGLQLEHPLVTSLYTSFVLQGDFPVCETLLTSMASASLFTSCLLAEQPSALWTRLHGLDADGDGDVPSARGGHAMCIDPEQGHIYLFGGWDGQKNLDDFWRYDIRSDSWKCLSYATQRDLHGPSPRSCHKMLFDTASGCIYVFGRLDEGSGDIAEIPSSAIHTRGVEAPASSPISPRQPPPFATTGGGRRPPWATSGPEFYRYHTRGRNEGKWDILSFDTTEEGGPPLVFDHQMAVDSAAGVIYVSGGRVVDGDWDSLKFSGLYSYDISKNSWNVCQPSEVSNAHTSIPSRFGHSMVLDSVSQTLFIFGGQRDDKYLSDMYAYHIPSNTVSVLFSNFTADGGPDACFTQRAVIDSELREIYVFCGLTRSKLHPDTVLEDDAPYWVYRYERPDKPGKWTKIASPEGESEDSTACPLPRYAHQVVYDPTTKTAYMHGGNARLEPVSEGAHTRMSSLRATSRPRAADAEERIEHAMPGRGKDRLDDFWKMQLVRPSPEDIIRRGKYLLRQQRFRELCEDSTPVKALAYLQTEVSSVVDHADPEDSRIFRSLLSHLLSPSTAPSEAALTRKRSREDDSPAKPSVTLDEDDPMAPPASPVRSPSTSTSASRSVISLEPDPEETNIGIAAPVSPARFKQRTEVFEQLMVFVNADAKQPDKDLARLINVDFGDV